MSAKLVVAYWMGPRKAFHLGEAKSQAAKYVVLAVIGIAVAAIPERCVILPGPTVNSGPGLSCYDALPVSSPTLAFTMSIKRIASTVAATPAATSPILPAIAPSFSPTTGILPNATATSG